MSGRPIKCVVVGDGTGKATTHDAEWIAKNWFEADFYFSRENMYADIIDNW